MSQTYSRSMLRVSVAQLCQNLGWTSIHATPMELLTDILERYIFQLANTTHRYSEQFGRTEPNLDDLGLSLQDMNVNIRELEDYVRHVESVPCVKGVPHFPIPRPNRLNFPKPNSREMQERNDNMEFIDSYFPPVHEEWNEEVISPVKTEKNGIPLVFPDEIVPMQTSPGGTGAPNSAEKRPFPSTGDGTPPNKKPRILPEEAGHSQYEMKSVMISSSGFVTPTRPGKLPDARTPPTAHRSLSATSTPVAGTSSSSPSSPSVSSKLKPKSLVVSETIEQRTVVGEDEDSSKAGVKVKQESLVEPHNLVPKPLDLTVPGPSKSPKASKTKGAKDSVSKLKGNKISKSPKSPRSPKPGKSTKSKSSKPKKSSSSKQKLLLDDKVSPVKQEVNLGSDKVKNGLPSENLSSNLSSPPSPPPPTRIAGPIMKKLIDMRVDKPSPPADKDEDSQEPKLIIADDEAAKLRRITEAEVERLTRIDDTIDDVIKSSMVEMDRRDRERQEQQQREEEERLKREKEEEERKRIEEEKRNKELERKRLEEEEEKKRKAEWEAEQQRIKAEKAKEKKIERSKKINDTIDDVIRQSSMVESPESTPKTGSTINEKEKNKDIFEFSDSEDEFNVKIPTVIPTIPASPKKTEKTKEKPMKVKTPVKSPLKLKLPEKPVEKPPADASGSPVVVKEMLKKKLQSKTVSPEWPKVTLEKITPEEINRFEFPSPGKSAASMSSPPGSMSLSNFMIAGMHTPSPTKECKEQPPLQTIRIGLAGKDNTKLTIKSPKVSEKEKEHKKDKKKKKNKDKDKDRDKKDRKDKDKGRDKKDKERKRDKDKSKSKLKEEGSAPSIPKLTFKFGGGGSSNPTVSMMSESDTKPEPSIVEPLKLEIPKLVIKPPILRPEPPPSRLSPKPPPHMSTRAPPPSRRSPPVPLSASPLPSPMHPSPSPSPPHDYEPPPPPARLPTPPPPSRLAIPPPPPSKLSPTLPPAAPPPGAYSNTGGQCTLITETVGTLIDDSGQRIWICPACKLPDDGSPMIGCDDCDDWYHWPCVGIEDEPNEDNWFCPKCNATRMKNEKKKKRGPVPKAQKAGKKKKH